MKSTRRGFLKGVSAGVVCITLTQLGFDLSEAKAYAKELKTKNCRAVTSVCPFCAVCCQIVAYEKDGKLIATEGDPDFPVNEGSLCAKGASLWSMYTSKHRLTKPLYRAPNSDKWEEKDWDWTLDRIAHLVKETRDKDFIEKNAKGEVVNRLESMFWMGTSHASNEECAIITQSMRSLGVVSIDHQARV